MPPLYRLYGQAFEEAGFDEHADVQSGMGEVYISKKGDPEGMFVANFEDVNDFMNRIHTSMVQGKLTDEKRIKEIIFQGVLDISRWRDYPDFEKACGYGFVTGIGGANCRCTAYILSVCRGWIRAHIH